MNESEQAKEYEKFMEDIWRVCNFHSVSLAPHHDGLLVTKWEDGEILWQECRNSIEEDES